MGSLDDLAQFFHHTLIIVGSSGALTLDEACKDILQLSPHSLPFISQDGRLFKFHPKIQHDIHFITKSLEDLIHRVTQIFNGSRRYPTPIDVGGWTSTPYRNKTHLDIMWDCFTTRLRQALEILMKDFTEARSAALTIRSGSHGSSSPSTTTKTASSTSTTTPSPSISHSVTPSSPISWRRPSIQLTTSTKPILGPNGRHNVINTVSWLEAAEKRDRRNIEVARDVREVKARMGMDGLSRDEGKLTSGSPAQVAQAQVRVRLNREYSGAFCSSSTGPTMGLLSLSPPDDVSTTSPVVQSSRRDSSFPVTSYVRRDPEDDQLHRRVSSPTPTTALTIAPQWPPPPKPPSISGKATTKPERRYNVPGSSSKSFVAVAQDRDRRTSEWTECAQEAEARREIGRKNSGVVILRSDSFETSVSCYAPGNASNTTSTLQNVFRASSARPTPASPRLSNHPLPNESIRRLTVSSTPSTVGTKIAQLLPTSMNTSQDQTALGLAEDNGDSTERRESAGRSCEDVKLAFDSPSLSGKPKVCNYSIREHSSTVPSPIPGPTSRLSSCLPHINALNSNDISRTSSMGPSQSIARPGPAAPRVPNHSPPNESIRCPTTLSKPPSAAGKVVLPPTQSLQATRQHQPQLSSVPRYKSPSTFTSLDRKPLRRDEDDATAEEGRAVGRESRDEVILTLDSPQAAVRVRSNCKHPTVLTSSSATPMLSPLPRSSVNDTLATYPVSQDATRGSSYPMARSDHSFSAVVVSCCRASSSSSVIGAGTLTNISREGKVLTATHSVHNPSVRRLRNTSSSPGRPLGLEQCASVAGSTTQAEVPGFDCNTMFRSERERKLFEIEREVQVTLTRLIHADGRETRMVTEAGETRREEKELPTSTPESPRLFDQLLSNELVRHSTVPSTAPTVTCNVVFPPTQPLRAPVPCTNKSVHIFFKAPSPHPSVVSKLATSPTQLVLPPGQINSRICLGGSQFDLATSSKPSQAATNASATLLSPLSELDALLVTSTLTLGPTLTMPKSIPNSNAVEHASSSTSTMRGWKALRRIEELGEVQTKDADGTFDSFCELGHSKISFISQDALRSLSHPTDPQVSALQHASNHPRPDESTENRQFHVTASSRRLSTLTNTMQDRRAQGLAENERDAEEEEQDAAEMSCDKEECRKRTCTSSMDASLSSTSKISATSLSSSSELDGILTVCSFARSASNIQGSSLLRIDYPTTPTFLQPQLLLKISTSKPVDDSVSPRFRDPPPLSIPVAGPCDSHVTVGTWLTGVLSASISVLRLTRVTAACEVQSLVAKDIAPHFRDPPATSAECSPFVCGHVVGAIVGNLSAFEIIPRLSFINFETLL